MAAAKQRWRLLAKACTTSSKDSEPSTGPTKLYVSRVGGGGFGFVKAELSSLDPSADQGIKTTQSAVSAPYHLVSYNIKLSGGMSTTIVLRQRKAGSISLADHRLTQACGVDSTGLVCLWPAEEAMTHYCVRRPELFRGKRVIELGAGFGLAGLAIAACTQAKEVVLTDGNPEVIDALLHNVQRNAHLFGETSVTARLLRWGDEASLRAAGGPYDVIVAADCTFFKEYHTQLAATVKSLLTPVASAAAIQGFECPENDQPVAGVTPKGEESSISVGSSHHRTAVGLTLPSVDRERYVGRHDNAETQLERQLGGGDLDFDERAHSGPLDTCTEPVCQTSPQMRAKFDGSFGASGEAEKLRKAPLVSDRQGIGSAEIGKVWREPCALLFNPQRGGTLNRFVDIALQAGLQADLSASYDLELDRRNQELKSGDCIEWPGYTEEHCRPYLLTLRVERTCADARIEPARSLAT